MTDYRSSNSYRWAAGGRVRPPWVPVIMEIVWMLAALVLVAALSIGTERLIDAESVTDRIPFFGGMLPLGLLLILVALVMLLRGSRRKRSMIVINYLEQAVRQNLPVPQMLAAAERTETGLLRQRLARLRESVEGGTPLDIALAVTLPGIPMRTVGLVGSGERLGRLPQVLARAVRPGQVAEQREPLHMIYLRWYPLAMLVTLTLVCSLIMVFLIPKYRDIFQNFHLQLPKTTVRVLDAYQALVIPMAVALGLVLAIFCGRMIGEIIGSTGDSFPLSRWVSDHLAWITPIWRGIVRHRALADVCQVMADALAIGQPADIALSEASRACDNIVLRKRIVNWATNVTKGMDLSESARRAKLPPLVVNLLKTAHGPDAARNVFAFLARYYDSRHSAAVGIVNGAAIPLMVGVFGFVVASIALAMFMPLINLMNHLPVTGRLM